MYQKFKDFQLLLASGVIFFATLIAMGMLTSTLSGKEVSAKGSAYQIVNSDEAMWRIEVVAKSPSKTAAYSKLKNDVNKVIHYLRLQNIDEKDMEFLTITSYPNFELNPKTGYSTNKVESYTYSQTIQITSSDVEKIKNLSNEIQTVNSQGVDINSMQPEYYYSKIADLKVELLSQATKDAKERANAMLKATNNHVGSIKSVKMGIFQITQKNSTDVSDWGINDTSTIEKKVTAVANVVFEVK